MHILNIIYISVKHAQVLVRKYDRFFNVNALVCMYLPSLFVHILSEDRISISSQCQLSALHSFHGNDHQNHLSPDQIISIIITNIYFQCRTFVLLGEKICLLFSW